MQSSFAEVDELVESKETGRELCEFLESNNFVKTAQLIDRLLKTHSLNRLKHISYLGSIRFALPDKRDFSRWDHSIGTAHLIAKVLIANSIKEEEGINVIISGLLHDIGNVFFSHIGEAVLRRTRGLDQGKLFRQVVGEKEIRSILEEFDVHYGNVLTAYQRWELILDSHFDCDTLDGINRTAQVLGLNGVDWANTLPGILRFDGNDFFWDSNALDVLSDHWNLKGQIYSDFVDSEKNQACEAMLEHIIELLDVRDIWISDDEVIELAKKDKTASIILKNLQDGEFYDVINLIDAKPPVVDKWSQNEEDEVWLGVVIDEFQERNMNALDPEVLYFRIKTMKLFTSWNLDDIKEENDISWSAIENVAGQSYQLVRYCQACVPMKQLTNRSRGLLQKYKPRQSTFHKIPLALREAETLYRWERNYNWNLKEISYDTDNSGVEIIDGYVTRLHIDAAWISPRARKPEVNLKDIDSFEKLRTLRISTKNHIPDSVGSLQSLEELYLKIDTRDEEEYDFPESLFSLPALRSLEIYFWGPGSIPSHLGRLQNLESLKLRAFGRLEIPSSVGTLSKLKHLEIEVTKGSFMSNSTGLIEIPNSIGDLKNLENLHLEIHELREIPQTIGQLSGLKTLKINRTKLVTIPESLSNLQRVEELDLQRNHLISLPDVFTEMKTLRILNIQENELQDLPDSISNASALKEIDISKNRFSILPSSLSGLRLKKLRCRSNPIECIPEWCVCIEELSFSDEVPLIFPNKGKWCSETIRSVSHSSLEATVLPPMSLKNHQGNERKFFEKVFHRSIGIITNLDDYAVAFLEDPTFFRPYVLKLGSRMRSVLENRCKSYREDSWQKELLSSLIEANNDIEKKREVSILFVSIFEDEGSKTYPLGVLTLATLLKQQRFSSITYLEYLIQYCDSSSPSKPFNRFSGFDKPNPWETQFAIFNNFSEYESFFSEFKGTPLILIGPIFTCYLQELVFLARKIRAVCPDAIIIAGGPHFDKSSEMDEELLMMCPELDGIVVGEAEQTIIDLAELRLLENTRKKLLTRLVKKPLSGVKVAGSTFNSRPHFADLDQLPFPDLDLLESISLSGIENKPSSHMLYTLSDRRNPYLTTFHGVFIGEGDWGATADDAYLFVDKSGFKGIREIDGRSYSPRFSFGVISGSRGCPFKCSFCASHDVRRVRSANHVFREMLLIHERFDVNLFVFFDPLFTTTRPEEKKRVEQLCDLLITSGLSESIAFEIEIRADVILNLPKELIQMLILAGCRVMNLGLEKGSNKALARIDKKMRTDQQDEAIRRLRRASKAVGVDLLINGTFIIGGPEETRLDIKDTIIHSFSLDLDGLAVFPLEIHLGTEDYKTALKKGIINPGMSPYLHLKRYPLFYSLDVPQRLMLKLNDNFTTILDALKEIREEINRLGTELDMLLPRISSITGISNSTRDNMLGIADQYARWFQKRIRSSVAALWRQGTTSFHLSEMNALVNEIELIEEELINNREQSHEENISDYRVGALQDSCEQFLKTFTEFVMNLKSYCQYENRSIGDL